MGWHHWWMDIRHAGAGSIVDVREYVDSNWSVNDGNPTSSASCMGNLHRDSWYNADNVYHMATVQIESVDHHAMLERSGSTADAAEYSL